MAVKPADNHCNHCKRILAELGKTNRQLNILLRALLGTIDASPRRKESGPTVDDEKVAAFCRSIGGRWEGLADDVARVFPGSKVLSKRGEGQ